MRHQECKLRRKRKGSKEKGRIWEDRRPKGRGRELNGTVERETEGKGTRREGTGRHGTGRHKKGKDGTGRTKRDGKGREEMKENRAVCIFQLTLHAALLSWKTTRAEDVQSGYVTFSFIKKVEQ